MVAGQRANMLGRDCDARQGKERDGGSADKKGAPKKSARA